HPLVSFPERTNVRAFIDNVTPHRGGDTALFGSVKAALEILAKSDRRGRIVVVTDGEETCGGNMCALAESVAKDRPGTRIDVVDLSGQSDAGCLAEATGGVSVTYAQSRE